LADAVAASSAFPPFLSPMRMQFDPGTLKPPAEKTDSCEPPFTTRVRLTDGGVFDNLGVTTSWKKYRTILISDAGGRPSREPTPPSNWIQLAWRAIQLTMSAGTEARKIGALDAYEAGDREGAYWGIASDMARYIAAGALPCPVSQTMRLAGLGTQLRPFDVADDRRLVNWGYAITDAAVRKHVWPELPAPSGFPFAAEGVGA
jgi:NTE family protein